MLFQAAAVSDNYSRTGSRIVDKISDPLENVT